MSNKIDKFSVLFVKRNAAKRGPTSSEAWNDTIEELSHDLTELSSQWNERLVPLLATVPNGSEGNENSSVDAWTDGLDGSTLFANAAASLTSNAAYFNGPADRPNTILEQLEDLYSEITTLQDSIAEQIAQTIPTAQQISVADGGGLYLATNVETALAEVMTKADLALSAGFDLSAIDQNVLPSLDNVYDLGNNLLRWKDLYLGPASLNIVSKVTDSGYLVAKDFHLEIASGGSGTLQIKDGAIVVMELDANNGVSLPLGLTVRTATPLLPSGTTQTINLSLGEVQTLDLEDATGNVTVTLTNPINGKIYTLKVIQDSSTPRNVIWPGTVKWPSGSIPTISTGSNAIDLVTLFWDGTNYYASIQQNFS